MWAPCAVIPRRARTIGASSRVRTVSFLAIGGRGRLCPDWPNGVVQGGPPPGPLQIPRVDAGADSSAAPSSGVALTKHGEDAFACRYQRSRQVAERLVSTAESRSAVPPGKVCVASNELRWTGVNRGPAGERFRSSGPIGTVFLPPFRLDFCRQIDLRPPSDRESGLRNRTACRHPPKM